MLKQGLCYLVVSGLNCHHKVGVKISDSAKWFKDFYSTRAWGHILLQNKYADKYTSIVSWTIRQDGRVLKIHTWLVKTMKTKVTFTNFIPRVLQRVSQTINNLCNSCSFLPRHVTYCTGMKPEIFLAFGGFQLNLILRLLILGFYNPLNTPIMVRYANITNNNKRRYIQKYIISRGQLKALLSCAETWLLWTKAQLTLTGVKIANQNIFPNIRQFHNTVLTYSPCNELKMH